MSRIAGSPRAMEGPCSLVLPWSFSVVACLQEHEWPAGLARAPGLPHIALSASSKTLDAHHCEAKACSTGSCGCRGASSLQQGALCYHAVAGSKTTMTAILTSDRKRRELLPEAVHVGPALFMSICNQMIGCTYTCRV